MKITTKIFRPDYSMPTTCVSIFPYQEQINKTTFLNYKFSSGDTLFWQSTFLYGFSVLVFTIH